jgi:hypothetical protein
MLLGLCLARRRMVSFPIPPVPDLAKQTRCSAAYKRTSSNKECLSRKVRNIGIGVELHSVRMDSDTCHFDGSIGILVGEAIDDLYHS